MRSGTVLLRRRSGLARAKKSSRTRSGCIGHHGIERFEFDGIRGRQLGDGCRRSNAEAVLAYPTARRQKDRHVLLTDIIGDEDHLATWISRWRHG